MDPDTAPVGPPASGTPCILAGRPRGPAGHRLGPAHGATVMPKDAPASPPNVLRGAAARACPCPPSLPRPHGSDVHGRRGGHRLSRSTAPQLGLARRSLLADPASGASPSRCSLPHPSSSSASPPSPPGSCVSPSRLPSAVLLRVSGFRCVRPTRLSAESAPQRYRKSECPRAGRGLRLQRAVGDLASCSRSQ